MIGIVESGRRAARAAARSRALYETVGHWVPDETDPRAKLLFAIASRHHAEHAERWDRVVPLLHDVDLVEDVELAAPVASADGTTARLAAYRAELEGFDAELGAWDAAATPESDGPSVRLIALVRADVAATLGALRAVQDGDSAGPRT